MRPTQRRLKLCLGALVALASCCASGEAADSQFWTLTPYKVRVLVAAQTRSVASTGAAQRIATHLSLRADAAIGPIWDLSVEPLTGDQRIEALAGQSDDELLAMIEAGESKPDKLIVLTVKESLSGVTVEGVEADRLLAWVGPRREAAASGPNAAAETAFRLLCDVFSPVAIFEVNRETGEDVTLALRGSQLPTRAGAPEWLTADSVLLPILRRTDREGNVAEDGIQAAPWTYLLVTDTANDDGLFPAKIYSHTRRPFGVRRRGRVSQYAIVLDQTRDTTSVHLHAKEKPDQPLSGYHGFAQDGDKDVREPIGVSDSRGRITVEPGESPIQTVFIKSGSTVVAKAPVPAGRVDEVVIPLLDERARLQAEAKLSLLREELIDLIARRSIMASRIEDLIKKGKKIEARQLLDKLDGMPGRAQFNQRLVRAQQQSRSDDPVVQKRIDKSFSQTTAVIGAFLGTGKVQELRAKLAASGG